MDGLNPPGIPPCPEKKFCCELPGLFWLYPPEGLDPMPNEALGWLYVLELGIPVFVNSVKFSCGWVGGTLSVFTLGLSAFLGAGGGGAAADCCCLAGGLRRVRS